MMSIHKGGGRIPEIWGKSVHCKVDDGYNQEEVKGVESSQSQKDVIHESSLASDDARIN